MSIAVQKVHSLRLQIFRRLLPTLFVLAAAAQCSTGVRISESEFRSSSYNGRIAHALAELSNMAYEINYRSDRTVPAELQDRIKKYINIENSAVFFDSSKDTAGYIVANDDVVIVVFRGTQTVRNMLTDINATKSPFAHGEVRGQVHSGFLNAGRPVFPTIQTKIRQLQNSGQPILFTGHSLGGALATLAVARRLVPPGQVFGLYTYGSPRVGDKSFAETFNGRYLKRTYRFANHRDPVTKVPPEVIGYRHVGRLFYFDDDGDIQHAEANPHSCGLFGAATCGSDHGVANYVEFTEDNLDENPLKSVGCFLWPF